MLLGLGAVKEAVKDFDRALLLAPGYAAAYSNRAGAYMKLGQTDRAIADYTKAIELTPNSAAALSGRGRAHLAAYRPHGAIRDFTRAVGLDARFSAAYRSRAEAKMAIERYEEAIEDFSRAIAFEPRNAEIYALRGAAYMEADNAASGIKDLAKAIELGARLSRRSTPRAGSPTPRPRPTRRRSTISAAPSSSSRARPRTYAYRAWTYRQQQQAELGLKDVERALKLDDKSAEAYWARGEINESLGRAELAVPTCARRSPSTPASRLPPRPSSASASARARARRKSPMPASTGWRVFQKGRQFIATNDEFPRLRINLEMMGRGQPRILEWDVKKPPFAGIAVLRFHAGVVDGRKGPEDVEHAAVVDLQSSTVVSVEVQKQGEKQAQWTWDDGKLVVASADGVTDEFQLRQGKPKELPPQCTAQSHRRAARSQAEDAVRAAVRLLSA